MGRAGRQLALGEGMAMSQLEASLLFTVELNLNFLLQIPLHALVLTLSVYKSDPYW